MKLFSLAWISALLTPAWGQPLQMGVQAPTVTKSVIALTPPKVASPDLALFARSVQSTLQADLEYMDLFRFLPEAAWPESSKSAAATEMPWADWTAAGAELLLTWDVKAREKLRELEVILWNTKTQTEVFHKKFETTESQSKLTAHTIANEIVTGLTGMPGIFLTRIAMSCDRDGKKEVYTMAIDGSDIRQITQHRSLSFAPAWNPDSTRLAYSVVTRKKGVKNIDLYEYDLTTSTTRLLSNRKGINSGAVYTPDGKRLALTMSFLGNPEIFMLDPTPGTATRLTKFWGFDVDPAFSPDGKRLAFVSSRGGSPMVYTMALDGSDVKRLTYAGRYNATPAYSPQGNRLAFAGWIESQFDIFVMNTDGTQIQRLTKGQGNNEDPHFSPDGSFIAFSSNRTGTKNIYVMNRDGSFVRRLTYGLGNCVAPKWSGVAKQVTP